MSAMLPTSTSPAPSRLLLNVVVRRAGIHDRDAAALVLNKKARVLFPSSPTIDNTAVGRLQARPTVSSSRLDAPAT